MSDTQTQPDTEIPEGESERPFDNGLPLGAETPDTDTRLPDEPQQRRNVQVPVQEVQAERERRRFAEKRLEEMERLLAKGQERLDELVQNIKPQDVPRETPLPDPDVDPVGHFKELTKRQQAELAAIKARQAQYDEVSTQQREAQEMQSRYARDMQTFAAQQPDAQQSYSWLFKQLSSAMPAAAVQALEMQNLQDAWKSGENPVERLHKLAVSMGYKGASRQPIVAGPGAEETLEVVRRGQERASASLSNGSTNGQAFSGMTFGKIANMSDDEYARFARSNPAARMRALGQ